MPGADFTDLDPFFDAAEFGTAASWQSSEPLASAIPAVVLFDAPGALPFDGVVSTDYAVTYRVSDWPALRGGDRVTIGAVMYEVRESLPIDDGLIARAALRRHN